MKKKLFNYFIIAALSVGFVSCGDDEEPRDPNRPYTYESTKSLNYGPVAISADSEFKQTKTMRLDSVVPPQYSPYVYKGVLRQNSSNIKILGLTNVPGNKELKDFTLEVKGTSNKFTIASVKSDMTISSNDALNFMQNSVNQMVANKSMEMSVSFTSATDISPSENVRVELNYHTDYSLK